ATEVHDKALRLLSDEKPFVLTTDLSSGSTALEERVPDSELPSLHDGQFEEPFSRPAHMVIVGAIHIAIPLHRLAKVMGYRVTVVDARAQFATRERFPEADEILISWPDEALSGLKIDRSTALVILTHDPKFDLPALRAALPSGAGYIGAIGSRKTNKN